jgi:hypothetical protein
MASSTNQIATMMLLHCELWCNIIF